MTNNANFNLGGRLFAYIQHGIDFWTSPNLMTDYNSSLIFIGDERQIYVPAKNAYVGIGMTAYSNTVAAIQELTTVIGDLRNTAKSSSVQKIFPGVSPWNNPSSYGTDYESLMSSHSYLTGNVEISGFGNYDARTGFAYQNTIYSVNHSLETHEAIGHPWYAAQTPATSGIRITYESDMDTAVDQETGLTYLTPGKMRMVIDDTQTWTYMTSAYTYSLNYTRDYTNEQVNYIYHNLIGDYGLVFVPVKYNSLFSYNAQGDLVWDPPYSKLWYKKVATAYMAFDDSEQAIPTAQWGSYIPSWNPTNNGHGYASINKDPDHESTPQYYVTSQVDKTTNPNIYDGLQTLKEVAYILDIITDGALGNVTYLTKSEYDSRDTSTGVTYYRIITNGVPTTNEDRYAYYITETDPNNVGIQIAYSIAGNSASISDLHYHTYLNEAGHSSLRGIKGNGTDMVTISAFSNRSFISTDTNQTLNSTYNVGDTNLIIDLELSSTYLTWDTNQNYATTNSNVINVDGVNFRKFNSGSDYPSYQLADLGEIAGISPAANTYFDAQGNPKNDAFESLDQLITNETKIYYQGRTTEFPYANDKFRRMYYPNEKAETDTAFVRHVIDGIDHFIPVSNDLYNWDGSYSYYLNISAGQPYKAHAYIYETNKIATTAWTLALFNDKTGDITSDLENTYLRAKNYIDEIIESLDATLIEPHTPYATADTGRLNQTGINTAYYSNRIRSQYISNVTETNGKLTGVETSELPTDEVDIKTSIWGNQDDNTPKVYKKLVLSGSDGNANNDVASTDLEKVFYAVRNSVGKQVYYKDGTTTYVEATPNTSTQNANTGYYIYNSATNEYIELGNYEPSTKRTLTAFSNQLNNSAYWKQLYEKKEAYYEVELDSIKMDSNNTYIESFNYAKYNVSAGTVTMGKYTGTATPELWLIDTLPAYSSKYITAEMKHYDYTVDGGFGQNRLNLTTHITHLEDASPVNTGLADAWDVVSFIENLCEWVDISASINENVLQTRSAFYRLYDFGTPPTTSNYNYGVAQYASVDIYKYNGSNYSKVTNATYYGYKRDQNNNVVAFNSASAISGTEFWAFGTSASTYEGHYDGYVRVQDPVSNPINLSLTKFGE